MDTPKLDVIISVIAQMIDNIDEEPKAVRDYLLWDTTLYYFVCLYDGGYVNEITPTIQQVITTSWVVLEKASQTSDKEYEEQYGSSPVTFQKSAGYFFHTPYPFTKDN